MFKESKCELKRIALLTVFILGNLVISFPKSKGVEQSFFGIVFCVLLSVITVFAYSRFSSFKGLIENGKILFSENNKINILICVALLVFSLICYAESSKDFIKMVDEIWLKDTPNLIISALFAAVSVWLAKSGNKCVYCFAFFSIIFIGAAVILMFALSCDKLDFELLKGVFKIDFKNTLWQTLSFYIHSFGQLVLCIIFIGFTNKKTAFKEQMIAVGSSYGLIILLLVNTAALLGTEIIKNISFPYAVATSIISTRGDYTRLDAISYYIYFITSLIKTAVIYSATLKIGKSINKKAEKIICVIFPASIILMSLSKSVYSFLDSDFVNTVLLGLEIFFVVFFFIISKKNPNPED